MSRRRRGDLSVNALRHRATAACAAGAVLCTLAAPPALAQRATAPSTSYSASISGHIVTFSMSGFEPDFDPVDHVIISAVLQGRTANAHRLPDATLVLSTYLENFQAKTRPILPDLLNNAQIATSLAGFMQGKAALVDGSGHISYRGSVLAETFLDNAVHMQIDLNREGAPATDSVLRLLGSFSIDTTHTNMLPLQGVFHGLRSLSPPELQALSVGGHVAVPWQSVVKQMAVRFPQMMGTAGGSSTSSGAGTPGGLLTTPVTDQSGGVPVTPAANPGGGVPVTAITDQSGGVPVTPAANQAPGVPVTPAANGGQSLQASAPQAGAATTSQPNAQPTPLQFIGALAIGSVLALLALRRLRPR